MNKMSTTLVSAAALCGAAAAVQAQKPIAKPNIIMILADDLGWMDTSFTGSKLYETPNIERLAKRGVNLDWERVQEIAGDGSVGRPHVAQAILEKGYIDNLQEAFTRYLAFGGPAYVRRAKMTPGEAIDLILKAKGIPVLAHPLTKG